MKPPGRWPLIAVLVLYAALSVIGLDWGLPSRGIDPYLFGGAEPWSGRKIYDLAGAGGKDSDTRGADVDADPLAKADWPVPLNDTDEKAAAIYLRYRLFTHQPDEMITMMALSRMRPAQLDFDPGLYQYGGLFIYPVGAVIRLCGAVELIDVRADLAYYLDHPEQFGRFYVAARAYAAAWGLVGIIVVYLIGRRLDGHAAGLAAALLCTVLPVVICMSHEAKPHLPGAVLMLAAVLSAMRYLDSRHRRDWCLTAAACGAALGMVLSSLPVLVLIPFAEWLRARGDGGCLRAAVGRAAAGLGIALGVYLVTNPYVPINLVTNRAVLASNFGNSLDMYEVSRAGEGAWRMAELTAEGATWAVVAVGLVGIGLLIRRRVLPAAPLGLVAGLIFVQFVLIGAGKPAEYGRFGVVTDVALAIAAACALTHPWPRTGAWAGARGAVRCFVAVVPLVVVTGATAYFGYRYLANFVADASRDNTRIRAAAALQPLNRGLAVLAEPAPYSCPPLDFARSRLWLFPSLQSWRGDCEAAGLRGETPRAPGIIATSDALPPAEGQVVVPHCWGRLGANPCMPEPPLVTPISWANKPFQRQHAGTAVVPRRGD